VGGGDDPGACTTQSRLGGPASAQTSSPHATHVFSLQGFITVMDALKLKLRAKDQLHPLLAELMTGYTRFKASSEWEGRPKILHWYVASHGLGLEVPLPDSFLTLTCCGWTGCAG